MAITKEEVKKFAELARIKVEDGELDSLSAEMDAILEYVSQVSSVAGTVSESKQEETANTMRADENPNEPGAYSPELIAEFPKKQGNYLKVKKIL